MRTLTFAAALALTCMACGKNKEADPVKLSVQPAELVFDAKGGTQPMTITSGIKPTVSCQDAWVSLGEGTYSANNYSVQVSAKENTGTTERTAYIRVIGDKQSTMVAVVQKVAEVELTADKTSISFDRFGGETVVTVTSSTQPSASTDAGWCLVQTGTIGSDKTTAISVAAPANRKASAQSGTLTVTCGSKTLSIPLTLEAYQKPETTAATALSPELVFETMAPGWNMGNHMDAISNDVASETAWGNAKATQATLDGVKAAGFKAVRICVTWQGHIGEAPAYRLDEKWLGRVEEIVGYAEKAGLVAIVNTHHDESYWLDINKASEKTKDEIFSVWTQIAQRFKDKGEWLVMESFNEIQDGGWGWSEAFKADPKRQYDILNSWNQVFVDAVRATGGNNATRWLGIPGYAASPQFTIAGLTLPQDYTSANRLIVAVHDYDPYDYTLSSLDKDHPNEFKKHQWGHTADPAKRCSDQDEKNVVDVFDNLKAAYLDKDIPVYLGEFGCSRHKEEDLPYQMYYIEYFCKAAADHLLPMYLWDNGVSGSGPEKHGYLNHGTGQLLDETAKALVERIVKAATNKEAAYTLESIYNSAPKN